MRSLDRLATHWRSLSSLAASASSLLMRPSFRSMSSCRWLSTFPASSVAAFSLCAGDTGGLSEGGVDALVNQRRGVIERGTRLHMLQPCMRDVCPLENQVRGVARNVCFPDRGR